MDLKSIMLSEISQRKTNTIWSYLYVESKKGKKKQNKELIDTENWLIVARGRVWRVDEMSEGDQNIQISSYKMAKSWEIMYSMVTIINNTILHIWKLLKE